MNALREPSAAGFNTVVNITRAELQADLKIALQFNDGTAQTVAFKPFLTAAQHPQLRAFLQPEAFASFKLEHGELVWGNYDLCFPMMDLYYNRIMPELTTQHTTERQIQRAA